MRLAFVLYDRFTALDLVGPYEVMSRWPDAQTHFVATSRDPVRADAGLIVTPTDSPEALRDPDVVMIPGSSDPLRPLQDEALIDWVKGAARSAKWLTSVCTGASIYAAAGLLAGRRATTHWAFREILRSMGVDVVAQRVVFDDPFVTGAGVSAGIDMALALTARVHGDDLAKRAQLMLEYDPHPPFDAGSPEQADARTIQAAIKLLGGSRPDGLDPSVNTAGGQPVS